MDAHLLRNLGEDIHVHFAESGAAKVPDMDSAWDRLHVIVSASRHLGTVTTYVKKAIHRHGLGEVVEISRASSYPS